MLIRIIAGVVFSGCLIAMHLTPLGIRGLKKYDASFRLFDMRFYYSPQEIIPSLQKLGEAGRAAYQRFLTVDLLFIASLLYFMFLISLRVTEPGLLRKILVVFICCRALFDVIENVGLIYLIQTFPQGSSLTAAICSTATLLKWVSMLLWIASVVYSWVQR